MFLFRDCYGIVKWCLNIGCGVRFTKICHSRSLSIQVCHSYLPDKHESTHRWNSHLAVKGLHTSMPQFGISPSLVFFNKQAVWYRFRNERHEWYSSFVNSPTRGNQCRYFLTKSAEWVLPAFSFIIVQNSNWIANKSVSFQFQSFNVVIMTQNWIANKSVSFQFQSFNVIISNDSIKQIHDEV